MHGIRRCIFPRVLGFLLLTVRRFFLSVPLWPELAPEALSNAQVLEGNGHILTFDFEGEVGGILSFDWDVTGSGKTRTVVFFHTFTSAFWL